MSKILVVGADADIVELLKAKLPEHEFVTENSGSMAMLMVNLNDKKISVTEVEHVLVHEIHEAHERIKEETARVKKILIVDDGVVNFAPLMLSLCEQPMNSGDVERILIHEMHDAFNMPIIAHVNDPSARYYHAYTKPYGKLHRNKPF